jgi:cohesin loading factor subunit SCC2
MRRFHFHLSPRLFRSTQVTTPYYLPSKPLRFTNTSTSDIIPLPSIGLRSSASLFSTTAERDEARQGLDSLNREAANPYETSQRLQQTLEDLKQLLQPENVAE